MNGGATYLHEKNKQAKTGAGVCVSSLRCQTGRRVQVQSSEKLCSRPKVGTTGKEMRFKATGMSESP